MPFKSKKQEHLFQAIAHGWKPPKQSKIKLSKKVAKKFINDSKK